MRLVRAAVATLLAMSGCSDGFEPLSRVPAPIEVVVEAARLDAVRVAWARVADEDVIGYAIERRANLSGPFHPLVAQVPQSALDRITWLDTGVDPETYYGYRIYAVTRFGDRSGASVVGGARTPSLPGVEVTTSSIVTSADAIDADGYDLTISGPDTVRAAIGVSARRRFTPLRPGRYDVKLSGLIDRCTLDGAATKTVDVTDTTAITVAAVSFNVTCRDPNRGDIRVSLATIGNDLDPEYTLDLLGEADDATLPPSERIVSQSKTIALANPVASFTNLRPGTYDITLDGVAGNCQVQGAAVRTVQVTPLGTAAIAYAVSCIGDDPPPSGGPFVWRNTWLAPEAAPGQRVTLRIELDLTAEPAQRVQGVSANIHYDPAVLRFDEETPGQLPNVSIGTTVPGRVSMLAAVSTFRTGLVRVVDLEFTVVGTAGATTTTSTENLQAGSPDPFHERIRIEEATFSIGTGGGQTNQPPTAEANGPYSATVGSAVSFSAAGSSDTDGTIASYSWNFGDVSSGTGQTATHAYAAAGTYTATLTVTDDDGAVDTDQATVTITSGGGGNTPPNAEANGPYTATVGIPVALSSTGSSDPNGTITAYSWSLGNGQTASGAAPVVTYPAAGTYTVTLTVTDNAGATDTDQATITVSEPASTKPLTWRATFGPVDVVNDLVAITVSYDLRTNLADTPGIETLKSFVVDSLKWDSSLLQFYSINLGPNVTGTSNQAQVFAGNLAFQGSVSGAQSTGLITIATIRFKLVGPSGSRATTATFLGTLQGAPSTNNFIYNAKTTIVEGEVVVP